MSDDLSADLRSLKIDRSAKNPDRPGPLRYAVILGALAGLGAIIYFVAVPYISARVFKTNVEVTEISIVSPAQASVELTSTGYVKPQTVSNVGPKVSGRVSRVHVSQGQRVEAGTVLYELDITDQKAAVAEANARVAAARAQTQTARANLAEIQLQAERASELAAKGVRPQSTADDLKARAAALHKQVSAADAEARASAAVVKSLEVNLDSYTVTTPIAGTILSKPPELGEVVSPSSGSSEQPGTVEIADFATLAVETDVPEGRLHMVQVGSPCEIVLDAFPGKRYRGKTLEIVPKINRAKATVPVKVSFVDDPERVLPEMAARVSFLAEEVDAEAIKQPPKLVVPETALLDRSGAKVVFVLDGGKLRMVAVQVGEPYAGGFVLLQGPPAGTKVVKNPTDALRDGQAVEERTDG
jgi:RND family efflux transporter MFP subunit